MRLFANDLSFRNVTDGLRDEAISLTSEHISEVQFLRQNGLVRRTLTGDALVGVYDGMSFELDHENVEYVTMPDLQPEWQTLFSAEYGQAGAVKI